MFSLNENEGKWKKISIKKKAVFCSCFERKITRKALFGSRKNEGKENKSIKFSIERKFNEKESRKKIFSYQSNIKKKPISISFSFLLSFPFSFSFSFLLPFSFKPNTIVSKRNIIQFFLSLFLTSNQKKNERKYYLILLLHRIMIGEWREFGINFFLNF